ncbi:MAG: PilZ domain-containing protein [Deferrisomatales bacterium]|nr:PilZ domain-containing protein [Deferrisomatales bacterium]
MTDPGAKRRFPRIPSENAVLIKKLGPEESEGFAKTRVVGLGGCMFVSDERLGVDSCLDLLISVRGRVVKTRGRVAYEVDTGGGELEVGVEFLEISPHDRAILQELFRPR